MKVGEEKKNGGSDGGDDDDHSYLATCVRNMLRDAHKENLDSQQKCLGSFRVKSNVDYSEFCFMFNKPYGLMKEMMILDLNLGDRIDFGCLRNIIFYNISTYN